MDLFSSYVAIVKIFWKTRTQGLDFEQKWGNDINGRIQPRTKEKFSLRRFSVMKLNAARLDTIVIENQIIFR